MSFTHGTPDARLLVRRPSWQLRLVDGLYAVDVSPPPECTTMVHIRGEIAPGTPAVGVVTTRIPHESARAFARGLAASFREVPPPQPIVIAGSSESYRLDGTIDMEEGLSEDGIERIVTVVARNRDGFVTLTLRTRPDDAVADAIEAIVASFALVPESRT